MMERVENVAGEFRKAAHSQMAATTQRTIRWANVSHQIKSVDINFLDIVLLITFKKLGHHSFDSSDAVTVCTAEQACNLSAF